MEYDQPCIASLMQKLFTTFVKKYHKSITLLQRKRSEHDVFFAKTRKETIVFVFPYEIK